MVLLCLLFSSLSHGQQDLFEQAEIVFDIDYIDIDRIQIFGNKSKGQVMAVWLKSGSVLTKTLLKSNSKNEYNSSPAWPGADFAGHEQLDDYGDEVYPEEGENSFDYGSDPDRRNYYQTLSTEELITSANDIISRPEWIIEQGHTHEEVDLMMILMCLKRKNDKGPKFVTLAKDVITTDLEHEIPIHRLRIEASYLMGFAEGDEELTKDVKTFLDNNGFVHVPIW